MRLLMSALAATTMFASVALADDPMSGAYGNTVTITNAKGETTKLAINEDSTYETTLPDGNVHKGKWAMTADGSQVCFTQSEPVPAPDAKPACGAVHPGKKAGDTWEQGEGENKIVLAIVPGR